MGHRAPKKITRAHGPPPYVVVPANMPMIGGTTPSAPPRRTVLTPGEVVVTSSACEEAREYLVARAKAEYVRSDDACAAQRLESALEKILRLSTSELLEYVPISAAPPAFRTETIER